MPDDSITISPGPQFRTAMVVALVADALQIVVFPAFVAGGLSPADDVLDIGIAALMIHLLGWHWEFLPSFFAKLVPGVDLVPFWTIAVVNVWRKAKQEAVLPAHEPGEYEPSHKNREGHEFGRLRKNSAFVSPRATILPHGPGIRNG